MMSMKAKVGRGLLLFALLLSLFAGSGGTQRAQAAGGLLAYVGNDSNIYLVQSDGSSNRKVLGEGGYYGFAWSPDGVYIAAQRAAADNQLVIYSLVSGKAAYVSIAGNPGHVTWAGGGGALAFDNSGARRGDNSTSAIYVVNADGSGLRQVVEGYAPAWSPYQAQATLFYLAPPYIDVNDSRCAYSEGGGVPSLLYLDSGKSVALYDKAQQFGVARPVWSPDGLTVAYGMRFWRRSDGKQTATIPPGTVMSWSPNSQFIAWTELTDGPDEATYRVRLHILNRSTNQDRVVFTAGRRSSLPGCTAINTNWADNGTRLAFADADTSGRHAIWYSDNAATLNAHPLSTNALGYGSTRKLYDLSPDGSNLVLANSSGDAFFLYNVAEGEGTKLGNGKLAQWQPSGAAKHIPNDPIQQPPPTRGRGDDEGGDGRGGGSEPSGDPNAVPLAIPHDAPQFKVWQRADWPVYYGKVQRSWLWGPTVQAGLLENYAEGKNGKREVLYLDKGRMEVNNPDADASSPWYITSGLLVAEMVGGYYQVGNNATEPHPAATLSVAGDGADNVAPGYAAFGPLTSKAADRSGAPVTATIDKDGRVAEVTIMGSAVSNVRYVAETGHNIPDVFWNFLNQNGVIYDGANYTNGRLFDWVYTMGYPITEPYWTTVSIGGQQHNALVQLYQRRTLTYVPDLAPGWQVQMGNVGLDYLQWRHG